MRFCAERKYAYMSVYAPTRVVKTWFDGYRTAAAELGYEPDPAKIVLTIPIYVAETDDRAHAEARQHILWLFHKGLRITQELYFPPGYMSTGSLRGVLLSGMKGWSGLGYEEILDQGYAIVGSPDTVGERLTKLAETLGFGSLNAIMAIGDITHEQTITSMELFAGQVMPKLRGQRVGQRV